MKGIFYGIGVGPGDPTLLTIQAVDTIKEVDILICPQSKKDKDSVALDIVKDYVVEDTTILPLVFPMVYQEDTLEDSWRENIEIITEKLIEGKNLGFITLGDPMLYSTYLYILPEIQKRGIEVRTIPGITSFSATASRTNTPLAMGDEVLAIFPLRKNGNKVEEYMEQFDNLVVMKPSGNHQELVKALENKGLEQSFVLVSKCGSPEETIITDMEEIKEGIPYLSTMIIKGRETYE